MKVDKARQGTEVALDELIRLKAAAQHLYLHSKKPVRTTLTDNHMSKLHGRGMDFSEFRIYQPGDDARCIDWRVTARTNRTHIRVYQEEHERPVFILLDQSVSMQFGTRIAFKSVLAAKAAAMIAWASYLQHDRVGGVISGCQHSHESRPRSGKQGVLRLFSAIVDAQQEVRQDNFSENVQRLRRVVKPGSLLFVISDFMQMDAEAERHLSRIACHNDVINIMMIDPLEAKAPPNGIYRFSDGDRQMRLNTFDNESVQAYQQAYQQHYQRIKTICHVHKMHFMPLHSEIPLQNGLQRLLRQRGLYGQ